MAGRRTPEEHEHKYRSVDELRRTPGGPVLRDYRLHVSPGKRVVDWRARRMDLLPPGGAGTTVISIAWAKGLAAQVMAWCLTRGVSVVRRNDLPTSVERHLIEPGTLDPAWRDRIRTLWAAWKGGSRLAPG